LAFNAEGGIMITIKNVRPGILIIPDAGIKLLPGETVPIDKLTEQIDSCLKSGHLISKDKDKLEKETSSDNHNQDDLSKLNATDAISRVNEEADPAKLKGFMETEKRRTVIDALKNRLTEVDVDPS
jgi:hypothetical protein